MQSKFALKTLVLAFAAGSFTLSAVAQWQWTDKDGRRVFSDRSPPAEIQEKDILKRPASSIRQTGAPAADLAQTGKPAAAASAPASKASAPKLSGKDAELEARKKKAEDDDATRKKAEDEKAAKAKADNCERAKTQVATLQSGVRMGSVSASGEREIMDDGKRAMELKRAQDVIESSCK